METQHYQIGGLLIEIEAPPYHESEHLAAFRSERCQRPDLRVTVQPVPEVLPPENVRLKPFGVTEYPDAEGNLIQVCLREWSEGLLYRARLGNSEVLVEYAEDCLFALGTTLILRWMDLVRQMLRRNAVFLHTSYVGYRGKAILFTAPKQTGKSTQARLWAQYRGAEQINGDRALLRQVNGQWMAFGSPFCGSSDICENRTLPIAAIVSLHQAPFNRVTKASPKECLLAFLQGVTYNPEDRQALEAVIRLGEQISAGVPILRLDCLPDEDAVAVLHKYLIQENVYAD